MQLSLVILLLAGALVACKSDKASSEPPVSTKRAEKKPVDPQLELDQQAAETLGRLAVKAMMAGEKLAEFVPKSLGGEVGSELRRLHEDTEVFDGLMENLRDENINLEALRYVGVENAQSRRGPPRTGSADVHFSSGESTYLVYVTWMGTPEGPALTTMWGLEKVAPPSPTRR